MLLEHGYYISDYHNWEQFERCVILRHDIDKAVELAALEQSGGNEHVFCSSYL